MCQQLRSISADGQVWGAELSEPKSGPQPGCGLGQKLHQTAESPAPPTREGGPEPHRAGGPRGTSSVEKCCPGGQPLALLLCPGDWEQASAFILFPRHRDPLLPSSFCLRVIPVFQTPGLSGFSLLCGFCCSQPQSPCWVLSPRQSFKH